MACLSAESCTGPGVNSVLFLMFWPQEGAGFFDIDNEAFEAMSVEVKLLPRKLRFFCSSERRDQLAQMN